MAKKSKSKIPPFIQNNNITPAPITIPYNTGVSTLNVVGSMNIDGDISLGQNSIYLKDQITGWTYRIIIKDGQLEVEPVDKAAKIDKNINNVIS